MGNTGTQDQSVTSVGGVPAYGMVPANFPAHRKNVANVQAGSGSAKCLAIGTSETASAGVGSPGTNGIIPFLVAYLNAFLCKTRLGMVGINPPQLPTDARFGLGAPAWTLPATGGGWCQEGNTVGASGNAGDFTYAPPTTGPAAQITDSADWYYVGGTLTGTVWWGINGAGVVGNAVSTTKASTQISKFTTGLGPAQQGNVFHLTMPATGLSVRMIGPDAYLSTESALRVGCAGMSGIGTSTAWSNNSLSGSLACIAAYAATLHLIEISIDDAAFANPTSLGAFFTQLQTVITACKALGDVLLWTSPLLDPVAQATYNVPLEAQFNAMVLALANANNCGVVDIAGRLGPWSSWNTAQGFGSPGEFFHPNTLGNADIANALGAALVSVA